jgi:hypothetical protein
LALWEGYRGLEEYAREVFPLEEAANGLSWMNEVEGVVEGGDEEGDEEGTDDGSEGLMMGGGGETPARREESWLA